MVEFAFTVTHVDTATDLTGDVETITINERGTGQISSAELRLESDRGLYLTSGVPLLDEFQRIRIQITDDVLPTPNTFDKIYEIMNIVPVEAVQEGNVIDLELHGLEHHLQKAYFAKQFFFESAFEVARDIIDQYNENRASLQPEIVGHDVTSLTVGPDVFPTNTLPQFTANQYMFNVAEKRVYDGLIDVAERMGSTVAAGGAADFWEIYFRKHPTNDNQLIFQAVISGIAPTAGNEITITDADAVNEDPTEGGIDSTPGTITATWGADDFGTQPEDTAAFHSELEAFFAHRTHPGDASIAFPQDALVQLDGVHYQSNINNNTDVPPSANWTIKEPFDFLGVSEYSPWTNLKATHFKNSGSNPLPTKHGAVTSFNQSGFFDSNLVIQDFNHTATWVNERVQNDTGIDVNYLYGQATVGVYRGFRVLVDPNIGAIGNPFSLNGGLDQFGVAYSNNVAQHNGGTFTGADEFKNWDVLRVSKDEEEIHVIDEGVTYERLAGVWTDISGTARANHPFHVYTSLTTNAGVNSTFDDGTQTTTYGDTSAIDVQYDYSIPAILLGGFFADVNYYKIGAWLCLRFPYPHSTHNGLPANSLGQLWGNNATKKEPVTFDTNNMHLSHSGNVGFNHSEAQEYGPISALAFTIKLAWFDGLAIPVLAGNFKMRCIMYDTSDNVVFQDFLIPFNDLFEDVALPITNFQIYRARIPFRYELDNIAAAFVLNDLDIVNRFEFKNVKQIVWQLQEVYDDQGRYEPEASRFFGDVAASLGGRLILTLDRVHFQKPLLAVSPPVTVGRALIPEFRQQPLISNFKQLSQDNLAWLEVTRFRHKEYNIKRQGRLDIPVFDTFFLNKADLVPDDDTRLADTGGVTNNIRLVNKELTIKISKSSSESGDFVTYHKGIKRLIT